MDRQKIHRTMAEEYESRWSVGDPWAGAAVETAHAVRKNAVQRDFLAGRRYRRTIEVGCGNGNLTPTLAEFSDAVCSLDIAASAIARAREACGPLANVTFQEDNAVRYEYTEHGPWDLITIVETIYSLGWLYPLFDIAWMAAQMAESLSPDGRLLLTNTYGAQKDYLLRPYLIDTYRDLFRNVGLRVLREETLQPADPEHGLPALITLFARE
jgi:predicted TPR repeat methyltransferase